MSDETAADSLVVMADVLQSHVFSIRAFLKRQDDERLRRDFLLRRSRALGGYFEGVAKKELARRAKIARREVSL